MARTKDATRHAGLAKDQVSEALALVEANLATAVTQFEAASKEVEELTDTRDKLLRAAQALAN